MPSILAMEAIFPAPKACAESAKVKHTSTTQMIRTPVGSLAMTPPKARRSSSVEFKLETNKAVQNQRLYKQWGLTVGLMIASNF
jgi:hypothetical protein